MPSTAVHCLAWVGPALLVVISGPANDRPPEGDPLPRTGSQAALALLPEAGWPLFGGTNQRNMVNTRDTGIPRTWSIEKDKEQNVKWSVSLGTKAYRGPVVAGNRIFIGTNNGNPRDPKIKGDKAVLMCFEEKTGKFLWQKVHNKLELGRINDWPGIGLVSNPVVEGDYLYYVSNRCEVVCAQTTDGATVWSLDMIAKLGVFPHNASTCAPLIVGDLIFIVTSNGVDEGHITIPHPEAPSFVAVNKKTGEVKWKNNDPTKSLVEALKQPGAAVNIAGLRNKGELLLHAQWSNPVYAEPNGEPMVIFPGGDGWVRAFEPKSGRLLWKFDCNPKDSFYSLSEKATRNDFVATPVVWKDKLYLGVGQDPEHLKGVGHLWCIDITKKPANERMDLSPVGDNFDPKAAVNKDSGLVWHYGGFFDAKPKKGRAYRFGRTMSTCAVHDGLLYTADFDGYFYCLDALTGELQYQHNTDAETWSSPYWVDGHVYLGNEDGNVLVFKHGRKKDLVNVIAMSDDNNGMRLRAIPVVCNGVLYLTTEDPCKLWALAPKDR